MVSHRILLYIHLHRLVHLGSQTQILYVKLGAQFVLVGLIQCCEAQKPSKYFSRYEFVVGYCMHQEKRPIKNP